LKLHQALHGYAEGHRQLACSLPLPSRDAKTLLVLSDISGPGVRISEEGYLTGYPLGDAGLYAIARTWSAPEMSRPGCVWTHTLLIDFADLAAPNSFSQLLTVFRRPNVEDHAAYSRPIELNFSEFYVPMNLQDEALAKRIVGALYGHPSAKVICARPDNARVDEPVVALWSQQWPRLRRAFRFCTLAGADRSVDGAAFDLQLLPAGNQAIRTRFPKAVEAESLSLSATWLDTAISDLLEPKTHGLRTFLRAVGGDVSGGRAAFAPLCSLYSLSERAEFDAEALGDALTLLNERFGISEARAARSVIARSALTQFENLSDAGIEFLISNLDVVDRTVVEAASKNLGQAILRRRPHILVGMLNSSDNANAIAEAAVAHGNHEDLLRAIEIERELVFPVLRRRPDLSAYPASWRSSVVDDETLLQSLELPDHRKSTLAAMMTAGRKDLADIAVRKLGAREVLDTLVACLRTNLIAQEEAERWMRAAARPIEIAKLFASPEPLPRSFLALAARSFGPDELPNKNGDDPWLVAIRNADGEVASSDEAHLLAYLLARGLGYSSRNPAQLVQIAFEPTYNSVAGNDLEYDSWRLVDHRLPWSIMWTDWDKCRRLVAAIVSLFVDRQLEAEEFVLLVNDDRLFAEMASAAAATSRGRLYLREARRALDKGRSNALKATRRRQIDQVIK